jgi:hypothetical protein
MLSVSRWCVVCVVLQRAVRVKGCCIRHRTTLRCACCALQKCNYFVSLVEILVHATMRHPSQVLSRATQVQHLDLRVHGDGSPALEHTWLPALGRLTALRSLKLAVPHNTGQHIGGLSLLKHLTTLQVMPNADDGSQVFSHESKVGPFRCQHAPCDLPVLMCALGAFTAQQLGD